MAEGGNVPELGGYDYEFTCNVPECWECLVCHLTLKDPVQIENCGHRLCRICMESLFRRPSPTCPADRQPLSREKIFSDTACHRQILDLHVKCSYSGCSWTGELRAVEKHQSECLFKVVKCSNSGCTEMLTKQDMKTHETLECTWRKVNCEHCQQSVILNQKQFPRSDAKSHSQTHVESHMNLALRGLEATQHQVHELVTVVKDQSERIERQSGQIEQQSQQIKRLMSKDKEQSQQTERQSGQIKRQSQQIERLMSKDKEQTEQIDQQSRQIKRLMSKDKEQFEKIERLMSTVEDQSQQIKRLISKDKEQSEKMERSISTVQGQPPQEERHEPFMLWDYPIPVGWQHVHHRT